MEPLISVIVPVYNVEVYLIDCVESIIMQSYRNLEIILVDDGSTDGSGIICDSYKSKDTRIKVIHQNNRGLSAARNSGIDIARGEYIGFVDSDDFIHPEMYSRLMKNIIDFKVLLSFCQFRRFKDGEQIEESLVTNGTTLYSPRDVIYESLSGERWWEATSKLYHRSLFSSLRFPEGRTNEDYAIMMNVYHLCDGVAVDWNQLYYYRLREGSITTASFNIHNFDQIQNSQEVLAFIRDHYPDCVRPAEAILLTAAQGLLTRLYSGQISGYEEQEALLFKLIKDSCPSFVSNKYISITQRILLFAASIHPHFFKILNSIHHFLRPN